MDNACVRGLVLRRFLILGGTHVRNTAEIGLVAVADIEKKGKQNRRVRIALA